VPDSPGKLSLAEQQPWVIFRGSTSSCSCSAPSSTWRDHPDLHADLPADLPAVRHGPVQFGIVMLINCALA
jgi:hypothetical protein